MTADNFQVVICLALRDTAESRGVLRAPASLKTEVQREWDLESGCFAIFARQWLAPVSRKTWCTYQSSSSSAVDESFRAATDMLTKRDFVACLQQRVNKTSENVEVANNMQPVVAVSSHSLPPPVYISTPKSKVCWCPMSIPEMLSAPSLSVRNKAWYRFSKT